MHVAHAAVLVAGLLVVSASGFVLQPPGGEDLSPVPFDETLSTGLTGVDVQRAQSQGYVVPRAEVFYSQYEYVLGYYGMRALVGNLETAQQDRQFGYPMAVFVTDLSGTDPYLTGEEYIRLNNTVRRGWVRASEAVFVVDSPARTPGGPAVLPFGDSGAAEQFASDYGGTVVDWPTLRERLADGSRTSTERLGTGVADQHRWATERVADARDLLERPVSVVVGEDAPTLSAAVEQAPPNTTVVLPAGTYRANLTVDTPITIVGSGEDTVVTGDGTGTVLTVRSPDVAVSSLSVAGVGDRQVGQAREGDAWDDRIRLVYGRGDAGIRLADAHGALVENVTIDTPANGVVALNSTGAVVRDSTIRGSDRPEDGFMGVLAMYSKMVVEDTTFVGGRDGVYTHYANGIVVRNNTMSSLRYGLHEMYTSDMLAANNTVRDATVGIILMTRPTGISLVRNDVRNARIGISTAGGASYVRKNVLVDNEQGLAIGTDRSLYTRNTLVGNDVGIRAAMLLPTNTVVENDVVDNDRPLEVSTLGIRQLWAENGRGNHWGEIPGFDRNGDGIVDRPYRPSDPVDRRGDASAGGYVLTRAPATQALRQFQQAVPGLRGVSVVDPAPLETPVRPAVLDRVQNRTEGRDDD